MFVLPAQLCKASWQLVIKSRMTSSYSVFQSPAPRIFLMHLDTLISNTLSLFFSKFGKNDIADRLKVDFARFDSFRYTVRSSAS